MKTESIEWEMQQLELAIAYYEHQLQDALYVKQAQEIESIIHKLTNQLQNLEGKLSGRC